MSKKDYVKNIMKSTSYSAINVASTIAPNSFAVGRGLQSVTPNLSDLNSKMKTFISGNKSSFKQQMKDINKHQVIRTAKEAFEQAKRDISTGEFAKKSKLDSFDDFEFEDFDFEDFDFDDDSSEFSFSDKSSSQESVNSAEFIGKTVQYGSYRTERSIYDATAKIGGVLLASNNHNMTQTVSTMLAGFGKIDYDLNLISNKLDAVNENLVNIVKFNNNNTAKVNTAMMDYFDRSLNAMVSQSRTSLKQKRGTSDTEVLDNIFSGGFNAKEYKKLVKKNWENSLPGAMMSFATSLGGSGDGVKDILKNLSLKNITDGKGLVQTGVETIMKALLPKDIRKATKDLDKNLQLLLKYSLLKLGDNGSDKNSILGEIFGLKQANPNKVKLGDFKKDSMNWNGVAQRTLVDVIPSLLADISAGVNKTGPNYYDYNSGSFVSKGGLEKQLKKTYEKDIYVSMYDSIELLNTKLDANTKADYNKSSVMNDVNKLLTQRLKNASTTDDKFAKQMVSSLKDIIPMQDIRSIILTMEDNIISTREQLSNLNREIADGYNENSSYRNLLNKNGGNISQYYDDLQIMTSNPRYNSYGDDLSSKSGAKINSRREYVSGMKKKMLSPFNKVNNSSSKFSSEYKKAVNNIERLTFDKIMNSDTSDIDRMADTNAAEMMTSNRRTEESAANHRARKATSQRPIQSRQKRSGGRRLARSNRQHMDRGSSDDDGDGGAGGRSAGLPDGLSDLSDAMSSNQSAVIEGQDALNRSVNAQQSQNVGMFTKFFAPFASKIFGKNGLITKFMDNKYFQSLKNKTTKFLFGNYADGKFDGESGVFKNAGNYVLDGVDYLKHAFTGKEFKGRIMKGAKEDKSNSVVGYMKEGFKKAYDSILQYMFGKDYKEESNFYKRNIQPIENKFSRKSSGKNADEKKEDVDSAKLTINGRELSRGNIVKSISRGNVKDGNDVSVSADESPKEAIMKVTADTMSKFGKDYKEESNFYKRNIQPIENKFSRKSSGKNADEKKEDVDSAKLTINGRELSRGNIVKSISRGNVKDGNDVSVSADESPKEAIMKVTADTMSKFKSKINKMTDTIIGDDDDKKSFADKFKKQLPKVLTAGLIGGGLVIASGGSMGLLPSLFLPNSIIGGAIVGMGALFASKSESMKKFLFGEKDELGEKSGGVFSQKLQKSFVKALPIAIGAGSLGAIRAIVGGGSAIPGAGLLMNIFTPGGIIGASILSMAGALALKSNAFQAVLFGDLGKDGTFSKGDVENKGSIIGKTLNKVSKGLMHSKSAVLGGLKGAGIGLGTGLVVSNLGVLGSVLTPAGPIGAAVLGAAVGISSVSEKFQTLMFGSKKYDKDGNDIEGARSKDGLMSKMQMYLKTQVIEPVTQTLQHNLVDFGLWTVKNIKTPFELAFGPMVDSVRSMKDTFTDTIKHFFDKISEGVISSIKGFFAPASKFFLDFILKPIGRTTNIVAKGGLKIAGMAIASPLQMLSGIMAPQRHKIEKGFRKEYRKNSFQTLQNRWTTDPSRNEENMNGLQKLREYGNRGYEFLNRYFDRDAKDDFREEYANKGYRNVPKVSYDEDGNRVVTNEAKYFNSMDWFMRPVKNKRLRQWEKEEWKPFKKNDKSFQKKRRSMVREQNGVSDREYTDEEIANIQKHFKKNGIDSSLISNSKDINSMLYDYDNWDNKRSRIARGEDVNSAEFVKERANVEDKRWSTQEKFQENVINSFADGSIITVNPDSEEILKDSADLAKEESNRATVFRERASDFFHTVEQRFGESIQAQTAGKVSGAELLKGNISATEFAEKVNSGTMSQDEVEQNSGSTIAHIANTVSSATKDTAEGIIVGLESMKGAEADQDRRDAEAQKRIDRENSETEAAKGQGRDAKSTQASQDNLISSLMGKIGFNNTADKASKESIFSKMLKGGKNLIDLALSNPFAFASIALGSLFGVSALGRVPGLVRMLGTGLTKIAGTVSDILIKVLPSAIRGVFDFTKDRVVDTVDLAASAFGLMDSEYNHTVANDDGTTSVIGDENVMSSFTNVFLRNPALVGGTVNKGFGLAGKAARGIGKGMDSIGNLKYLFKPKFASSIADTTEKAAQKATIEILDASGNAAKIVVKNDAIVAAQRITLGSYVKLISNIFNKIADSGMKVIDKVLGKGATAQFKHFMAEKVFSKLLKATPKQVPMIVSKLSKGLIKTGGRIATLPAAGIFAAYDLITGAFEAANLFAIDKSEVDKTMIAISAIMKAFFGLGPMPIFSLVIDLVAMISGFNAKREIADFLYGIAKSLSGNEQDIQGLNEAQMLFQAELESYNIHNEGNELSLEAYNDTKNQGVFTSVKNFFMGKKKNDYSKYEEEAKFNFNPLFDPSTGGSITKDAQVIYGYNETNAGYGDPISDTTNAIMGNPFTVGNEQDNEALSKERTKLFNTASVTPVSILKGISNLFSDVRSIKESLSGKSTKTDTVGYGDGPTMSQYDSRWSNYKIGTMPNGKVSTMASGGCGPTSLAMAINAAGGSSVNPMSVAKYAKSNNYIVKGGSSSGLFENGARAFGVASSRVNGSSLVSSLKSGKPVVLSGRGSSSGTPYSPIGHIVTATGIDSNNNVVVNDPRKRYAQKYPLNTVTRGMTNGWAYRKSRSLGYGESSNSLLGYGDETSNRSWGSSTPESNIFSRHSVGLSRADVRPGHQRSVVQAFTTTNNTNVKNISSLIEKKPSTIKMKTKGGKSTSNFLDGYTDAEALDLFKYIATKTDLLKKPRKLNTVYDTLERRIFKIKETGSSVNRVKASDLLTKYSLSSKQRNDLANQRRKDTFLHSPELVKGAATLQLKVDDVGGTYKLQTQEAALKKMKGSSTGQAGPSKEDQGLNNIYWLNNLDGTKGPKVEFPVKNDMIYYSQNYNNGEGLWADKLIAGAKSKKTIREGGSTLSALGMVLSSYLNKSVTPNYVAKNWGESFFDKGSDSFDLAMYKKAATDVGLNADSIPTKKADIMAKLKAHIPVILRGNASGMRDSIFGNSSRGANTVVAYGLTPKDDILYHDPTHNADAVGDVKLTGIPLTSSTFKGMKNAYAFSDSAGAGYTGKVDKATFEWIDEDQDITSGGGIWDILREYFEKMAGYATEGIRSRIMGDEFKDPFADKDSQFIGSEDISFNDSASMVPDSFDDGMVTEAVSNNGLGFVNGKAIAGPPKPTAEFKPQLALAKKTNPARAAYEKNKPKRKGFQLKVPYVDKKVSSHLNPSIGYGDVVGYGDGYEQANGIPYYNQADPAWSKRDMNGDTIGKSGCVLSSYAMGISALTGKDYTPPVTYSRWPKFAAGGNIMWDKFNNAVSADTGIRFRNVAKGVSADELRSNLQGGKPALIYTKKSKAGNVVGSGNSNHAVLAVGLADGGKKVIINDPGSRKRNMTAIPLTDSMLGMNQYRNSRMILMSNADGSGMKGRTGGSTGGYRQTATPTGLEAIFERIDTVAHAGIYSKLFGKDYNSEEVQTQFGLMERTSGDNASSSSDVNVSGSNNAERTWNYLKQHGYSSAATAGIMGNIHHESAFNPNSVGDNGTSYGICQWHLGRKDNLFAKAKALGKSPSDLGAQLSYLLDEMSGSHKFFSQSSFKNLTDPKEAARLFCVKFERPKNANSMAKIRAKTALAYYNKYAGKPVGYGSGKGSPSTNSATLSNYGLNWKDAFKEDGKGSADNHTVSKLSSKTFRSSYKGMIPDLSKYDDNNDSIDSILEGYGDGDNNDIQFKQRIIDKLNVSVKTGGVESKLDTLIGVVSEWATHSMKESKEDKNITNNISYGDKNVNVNGKPLGKKQPIINHSSPSSVSSLMTIHKQIAKGTRG